MGPFVRTSTIALIIMVAMLLAAIASSPGWSQTEIAPEAPEQLDPANVAPDVATAPSAVADAPTTETVGTTEPAAALPPAEPFVLGEGGEGGQVFVIPVQGEIEKGLYMILNRAIRDAENEGARAIVLDMHTPGGRVDAAILIRDRLVDLEIPTYTYVDNMAISAGAFIALATDEIVMAPGSNIGGALPIQMGVEGPEGVGAKFESVFTSEMRKTAKAKGHPPEIAEAFSNPNSVIEGLKDKGEILTLDYDTAVEVGLAEYIAPTLEEMLEREGLGEAEVRQFEFTPTDRITRFLSSPAVMGILMLLGMGGLYLEIRTPGFGIPGIVGISSLALYFFGSYLANLSGYMEIIFFVLGLILIGLEVFVIPGFGIPGVAGILMVLGSIFFALFNWAPQGFDFHFERIEIPLWTMTLSLLALFPLMYLIGKLLPYTPLYAALDLEPSGAPSAMPAGPSVAVPAVIFEPGQVGTATTDLRPSGTATIGGRRVDVVTQGDYVRRGSPVEVIYVEGNRIVVREAQAS